MTVAPLILWWSRLPCLCCMSIILAPGHPEIPGPLHIYPMAHYHGYEALVPVNHMHNIHSLHTIQYITVTSHECFGISNNWQLDCLFNSLLRLTWKKTPMLCITGPLWGQSIMEQWTPLTTKAFLGYDFMIKFYCPWNNHNGDEAHESNFELTRDVPISHPHRLAMS